MQGMKKMKKKGGYDNNILKEKSLVEIKSIKIPENPSEKDKLMNDLKIAVTEIDMEIQNLKLRKDYYLEIISKISSDLEVNNQINPLIQSTFDVDFSTDKINFNSKFNLKEKLSLYNFSVNNHIFPLSLYENLFSNQANNLFIESSHSQIKETLLEDDKIIENNQMTTNKNTKNEASQEDLNSSFNLFKANSINSTRQSLVDLNNSNFDKKNDTQQEMFVEIEQQQELKNKNYEDFNNFDDYIPIDMNLSKDTETETGTLANMDNSNHPYKLLAKRGKNNNISMESKYEESKNLSPKNKVSKESSACKSDFIDEFESKPKRKYNKKKKETDSSENEDEIKPKTKKEKKLKTEKKEVIEICPNYELYSEENLKESMRNYGMKPVSNKGMIKALKEIFDFRKSRKLPEMLNEQLEQFLNINNSVKSQQDNFNFLDFNSQTDSTSLYFSQQYNTDKKSFKQLDDFKKQNIIKAIKENKEVWTKILRLEKIDISEIKDIINKKDIIAEKNSLKEFLLEKGINLI